MLLRSPCCCSLACFCPADIISGLSNRQFDDPDPSTSGYVGDTDIPREYFDLACPPGLFVTSYNYLTAEADGKQLLVGVTDITCGDAGTLVQPINNQGIEGGWAGNNGDANPTIHPMSIPRGSRFFSPMITINTSAVLLYGQSANLECRAGTLLAGMYGTYAQPGDVNAGETLALMCRSGGFHIPNVYLRFTVYRARVFCVVASRPPASQGDMYWGSTPTPHVSCGLLLALQSCRRIQLGLARLGSEAGVTGFRAC